MTTTEREPYALATIEEATAAIEERDGEYAEYPEYVGRLRAPANLGAGLGEGSIHDDATAQRLGFSGGTVAGSVHLQQFPPLLVRAFGPEWFERGGLSCYFRDATTHGVPVRPFGRVPAARTDAQIAIRTERDDGTLVLEGTARIGRPAEPSTLAERLGNLPERGETRILAHVSPGDVAEAVPTRIDEARLAREVAAMTEPLTWYVPAEHGDASPWGGPVINPGAAISILRACEGGFGLRRNRAVGLFGAIEINHFAGPMMVGRDYVNRGEVLHVGETPKSEYVWYRTTLSEGGTDVAEMIMMLRFMKRSSDLWGS